jgi:hypothetical protein
MEVNPHTLNQILNRIREQMRCPQCGTKIKVDFPSVKIAGDDFMLLQLKCESCTAFIVLHVNLRGQTAGAGNLPFNSTMNVSSTLSLSEEEMSTLRKALASYDGSFEKMFQENGKIDPTSSHPPTADGLREAGN